MSWRRGILVAVVFGVALLVSAPATLLERLLPGHLPVRLGGCTGTVWSGECRIFMPVRSGWMDAGALAYTWKVDFDRGPHMLLEQGGRKAGVVSLAPAGWTVTDFEFRSALVLAGALPATVPDAWMPTGRQRMTASALACDWRLVHCRGRARIEIADFALPRRALGTLGDYVLELELNGKETLTGQLSTTAGIVTVAGKIEGVAGGGLHLVGSARLGAGATEDIRRLLLDIARPDGADSFAFSYRLTI